MILNVETSGNFCSISLQKESTDEILYVKSNEETFQHGRDINTMIFEALKSCSINMKDLTAISINIGPGSYTSLRIGLSTVKGMCYGLGIPMITMTGFEILAHEASRKHPGLDYYIPLIDARRMEVYTSAFDKSLSLFSAGGAKILTPRSFREFFDHSVCFIGNGVPKWESIAPAGKSWYYLNCDQNAGMMGPISSEKYGKNKFSDLFHTNPLYIKKPNITTSKKQYFN
ncbi:tRNA (adenosine(37)-N6)-threonylcarbamoyltransferase complex dimerization subunit type 1 TsaB [Membranihabitans maritimus]|uniref:tRNA (adenosine(37)-N6)-threonylcarbamoyltransferase complex dimerization subunit type 1 TsaB n=1 Tax=Membranihabitans maritimus TaxID=2904244 RepID=UPI001F001305|nr:tRNA (adenosine(37)-N6)-threonylcarbamoyltransferase complex dimerization subunit type 1 TsaB [Membranihabitans maritimus]